MHIRRLELPDAPAYRALRLRGLREHPAAFTSSFEEDNLQPLAQTEKRLAASASTVLLGAFEGEATSPGPLGGVLVGVVGFAREERLKNRHKAVLIGLYVAPEATGQGVGRALIAAVVQAARDAGLGLLVLTVTVGHTAARALYAAAGFQSIGIEPDAIRCGGESHAKEHMALQLPAASAPPPPQGPAPCTPPPAA